MYIKNIKELTKELIKEESYFQKEVKKLVRMQTSLYDRNLLEKKYDEKSFGIRSVKYYHNGLECKYIHGNCGVLRNKHLIYALHVIYDELRNKKHIEINSEKYLKGLYEFKCKYKDLYSNIESQIANINNYIQ